ncbi:methyltransferase domain-containing protein [Streptomyces litmocidini]|uniref:methyltransferase domain-containing protein n=1 Tax=Streptomyces litmocidini TaxID=67318 RepID=UPI0036F8BBC8
MSALTTSVVAVSITPTARPGLDHGPSLRARSYELLGVAAGVRLLDVGCGGRGARGLRRRVDREGEMIAAARLRHPGHAFAVADATALPHEDGAWDAYRADEVLHELPDPGGGARGGAAGPGAGRAGRAHRAGLGHLCPGRRGRRPDPDDRAREGRPGRRTARRAPLPRSAPGPRVRRGGGGGLHRHLADARRLPPATGLAESAVRAGAVTPEQAAAWSADQTARAAADRFFLAVPVFTASGTRAP